MSARRFALFLMAAGILGIAAAAHAQNAPAYLFKWGQKGEDPGSFLNPIGIAQDEAGQVYVGDTKLSRVQVFDAQGTFSRMWPASKLFGDLAIGTNGVVYALAGWDVLMYEPDGTYKGQWSACGPGPYGPLVGIATGPHGEVYVTDNPHNRILKFDAQGNFLLAFGEKDQFKAPQDVAVDEAGNVYVADGNQTRIQKFDTNGKFIRRWGGPGTGDGQFSSFLRVTCDRVGHVYVADCKNGRMQGFDLDGNFLCKWGSLGAGDGQFSGSPLDPYANTLGRIYVVDMGSWRVQVFGPMEIPTPAGTNVTISVPGAGVTLTFENVVEAGVTTFVSIPSIPKPMRPPSGFYSSSCRPGFQLETTAHYLGTVRICGRYDVKCFPDYSEVSVFHWASEAWDLLSTEVTRDGECGKICYATACATATSLGTFGMFGPKPPFGDVAGTVTADCPAPGTPLAGVVVDAYETGGPNMVGTAVTDLAGGFVMGPLPFGTYRFMVVPPLGYVVSPEELSIDVGKEEPPAPPIPPEPKQPLTGLPAEDPVVGPSILTVRAPFTATCLAITPKPRSIGYWKHQVASNLDGKGSPQVPAADLCGYLDAVAQHFNSNALNPVEVYEPPSWGGCTEKLRVAGDLVNLTGSAEMVARARQQLMALLLNAAAGNIGLAETISADGATVSQAITYCDNVIDDPVGNTERAKTIADMINNGQIVPAGWIPLVTPQIAYRMHGASTEDPVAAGPNPAPGTCAIRFVVPAGGARTSVEIFNVAGQRVRTLLSGGCEAGTQRILWRGDDDRGRPAGPGVYFYRVSIAGQVQGGRFVMLK